MIDERFITELYADQRPKMVGWLVSNQVDSAQAEDLAQEAFVRLWQRRDTIRECFPEVSGLLWCIVRNLRIDLFRRNSHSDVSEDATQLAERQSDTTPPPRAESDRASIARCIRDELAAMPQELALSWRLYQDEELSMREIAARTGVSETLAKVRVHRARLRLRERLTREGFSD